MTQNKLSDNVARVFANYQKKQEALEAYKHTVNRIDDYFEYSNESISDRAFIHEQLDNLTKHLEKIYTTIPNDEIYYDSGFGNETYYKCRKHETAYPKGAKCPRCENES